MFNKRFSSGLAYQVSYTYSKSIDIGSSGWYGVEGQSVQDPYHYNNDRSVSGFDVAHVLSVNIVYDLPFGKGKPFSTGNRFIDYLVGGWQFNTITHRRAPACRITSRCRGDTANTGNTGYLRANLVGDPTHRQPDCPGMVQYGRIRSSRRIHVWQSRPLPDAFRACVEYRRLGFPVVSVSGIEDRVPGRIVQFAEHGHSRYAGHQSE